MIKLGPEPEGMLLRRADIFEWLIGLKVDEWRKIRPHLKSVILPGCTKPRYRKAEIKSKLVNPILEEQSAR